jgi:hypothetical protein
MPRTARRKKLPRTGDEYSLPAGTAAVANTLGNSAHVNSRFNDLAAEQNLVRPISAGGTGAVTKLGAQQALDLEPGVDIQAYDADLAAIAALGYTSGAYLIKKTAANTWALIALTAAGEALLDDADAAAQRTTLGLVIGTNVQAYDADLAQIAALADPNADRGLFWDDSAGAYAFLEFGAGLTLSGTTLTAGWTFSASTATTSGSSVTITGVPSSATEIEVYFHGVSMTVADPMNVQLTVGGSAVTSGYDSSASSSGANSNSTTGFVIRYTSIGEDVRGIMRLVKTDTGTWASSHGVKSSGNTSAGGGDVTGVGTVDGIRLTRIGTANFDAGSFRIAWR